MDKEQLDAIRAAREKWDQGMVKKTLDKFPERRDRFESTSGFEFERLYDPSHTADLDYLEQLGFPGEYPFTRGVQPTMYRGRFWTMRQYAGFGSAAETNARFRYLLEHGQTGLSVAFDLPTQMGYDSDHPLVLGEVGKVGVAIDSMRDMETLFDQIPLDKVSTSMTINAPATILLAMYIAVAEKQGVAPDKLAGTIQNDILKEYIARGTYIYPPRPSMRLVTDSFRYCSAHVPKWNTISISGYHIREAGSTAVQEVAFTLADGIAYVQAALDAGMEIDTFASRLSFFFNGHNNLLEEVAKFRAARRLWARIMKDRFGAKNPKSWMLRFHTQTAGSMLTLQQPENNIVRVAMQCLAAALGGSQSIHTNSMDEAISLPSEDSARIALRTQQILAHENGVADVIDPLGGAYFIEALTDKIEAQAADYIRRIDGMGGMLAAIESGYVQREIHNAAYAWQKDVEKKRKIIVGVNQYQMDEKKAQPFKIDPAVEKAQLARLAEVKASRDNAAARAALDAVRAAAREPDAPMMQTFIAAVKANATLGEICGVLREEFGQYRENVKF